MNTFFNDENLWVDPDEALVLAIDLTVIPSRLQLILDKGDTMLWNNDPHSQNNDDEVTVPLLAKDTIYPKASKSKLDPSLSSESKLCKKERFPQKILLKLMKAVYKKALGLE